MQDAIRVTKRDGTVQPFDVEKINTIVEWAVDGVKNTNLSDVLANAKLNIVSGISTKEIHKLLIQSAINLFNEENPEYQLVAARLLNYELRKEVWGGKSAPKLYDLILKNMNLEVYDSEVFDKYSESEINKLDEYIKHDRDFEFTYAGIRQLCDKYLAQNRKIKQLYETPQFAYMLISMVAFSNYPQSNRITYVKKAYDAFSKHKINLATPIMSGMRTKEKQYSSCILIDVDDTMNSIATAWQLVGKSTASKFGIGLNLGRIRGINSAVRGGKVIHTGLVPLIQSYQGVVKSCHQNSIRGGNATISFPIWHQEVQSLLVLKNNGGTEDSRARSLDYSLQTSKLFYQRFIENKNISLFSPHEVPLLYDTFGLPEFDDLYIKYENDLSIPRKTVTAKEIMSLFVKERTETGRIYTMNIDHANSHSAFIDRVVMSNLCQEVTFPTVPSQYVEDPKGRAGVCILGAINPITLKDDRDYENTCDILVRFLEELIDLQEYPFIAAENFAKKRRSLGIGFTNIAAYFAKNGYKYTDPDVYPFFDELSEKLQYFCLKSSVELAKERGSCEEFNMTKYSLGILPIDTYKKDVDTIVNRPLTCNWEELRNNIKKYGLRHSTLTSQMPVESSSVIQNATNGIEPVRSLLTYKNSKSGSIPVLVPEHKKWKYTLAFEMGSNIPLININAILTKYIDMSISTNLYYRYLDYPDGKLPDSVIIKDILYSFKVGLKNIYYSNSSDKIESKDIEEESCEGGACAI